MSARRRLGGLGVIVTGVLALASVGGVCGGPAPPSSDTCELPGGYVPPQLTEVEIGVVGANGQFRAFTEREIVPLVTGGQGSEMIVVNLRLRGTGLGGCVAQRTMLEIAGGNLISSEEAPLRASSDGAGAFITGDALLVYYEASGRLVRLRAEVAGRTAAVEIWTDRIGSPDAATPDAATPDARPVDAATDAAPDAPIDATPDA